MKKHLIVYGMVFILLVVGFIGCTEQENSLKIKLIDYDVQSVGFSVYDIKEGFQYFKQLYKYDVTGIIKNTGNQIINKVQISALFIDENESVLGTVITYVEDIEIGETKSFNVEFKDKELLEYIKDVEFEFELT